MPKQKQKNHQTHIPVLAKEVINYLNPTLGQSFLDTTAGYGGHAEQIIKLTQAPDKTFLVDRDMHAIEALKERFGDSGVKFIHSEFLSTLESLASEGQKFDLVLADLGVSSPHLEDPTRGFSFNLPGPLDMRMDRQQELNAASIVNQWPEDRLKELLHTYGQEPKAARIAGAIVLNRPFADTQQLAQIISQAAGWRAKQGKIHPATRSFQAIRIAVNDELNQLEKALPLMSDVLQPGGRMVVISFHSLEDRIVKQFLAEHSGGTYDAELELLTKKPVTARYDELESNPRARSAKLRAAAKIKTKRKG